MPLHCGSCNCEDYRPDIFMIGTIFGICRCGHGSNAHDQKQIPTYRYILATHSEIFEEIFNKRSSEIPITIDIEKFNEDTISAAIDFCYGKHEKIVGKETKLLEFAVKYAMTKLKDVCCLSMEKTVNAENVCEFIQIAHANNFEILKIKCLKALAENRSIIPADALNALPKEILLKAFCS